DLRGAAFGLARALGTEGRPAAAMAEFGPDVLGDWLAGLFAVSRDDIGDLVGVLDRTVGGMSEGAFLAALPALRQAFAFFPPRERERIAGRLLELRGVRGSARALLRTSGDPMAPAAARALEERVGTLLTRYGLGTPPRPEPGASPVPGTEPVPGTGPGTGTGTEGPPPSAAGGEAGSGARTRPAVVDGPIGVPNGPGTAADGTRKTAVHRAAEEPGLADSTGTVHGPCHGTRGENPARTAHGTEDDPKGNDR
ncbi:hypothetical protein GTY57_28435, partial [Streptomyces sp. SID5475]|nr:hypothetical protein [Streptomyces sp. SID5475]